MNKHAAKQTPDEQLVHMAKQVAYVGWFQHEAMRTIKYLQDYQKLDTSNLPEFKNQFHNACKHLERILTPSRSSEQFTPMKLSDFTLAACANDMRSRYHYAMQKRVSLQVTENCALQIRARYNDIEQALSNLWSNTMDHVYQPREDKLPKYQLAHVKINIHVEGCVLTYHDDGDGIPDLIADRVFDAGISTRKEQSLGHYSHGLGLYISRKIVESNGGRMFLSEERNGQGNRCKFVIDMS